MQTIFPCSACYLRLLSMPELLRLFSGQVAQQAMRAERRAGASYYSRAGESGHAQVTPQILLRWRV